MGLLIVNPNSVFDRTITLHELVLGAVMRTTGIALTAGGKGINVARVLRTLRQPSRLLVTVGELDAHRYGELLKAEGADSLMIEVPGGVRIASIYREIANGRVTVVNDAGDEMSEPTWRQVRDAVIAEVTPGDLVLCMGSFPPGVTPAAVADLVSGIKAAGGAVLIDTAPHWLAGALTASPDVVTPNLHEAEAVLRTGAIHVMDEADLTPEQTRERALADAAELRERGARIAIVTAGAAGVAVADADGTRWHPTVPVDVVSPVGAGDSFVAGFAIEWMRSPAEVDLDAAVRYGIATSGASCEQVLAGGVDPERVAELHRALLQQDGARA